MQRRRFETITTFSMKDEANDLRKQAQGMPPSIRRDDLLRLAQQAEAACQVDQWLGSPGLPVCEHPHEGHASAHGKAARTGG